MIRRSAKKIEAPIGKWPKVDFDPSGPAARIHGGYAAPSAWWSDGFPKLLMMLVPFILMPASCKPLIDARYYGSLKNMPGEDMLSFLLAWVIGAILLAVVAEYFGRKRRLEVIVTPETIHINGKAYMRGEGLNQFAIEEHEKAFDEAQARQRGHAGRIYADAMQVVMRYGEKRVPIASFTGRDMRKAEGLLVRLQTLAKPKGLEQLVAMAQAAMPGAAKDSPPPEPDDFGPARPIR